MGRPKTPGYTAVEIETLELAEQGLSNEAIAKRLCLSIRSVEARFERIYERLKIPVNGFNRRCRAIYLWRNET